MSRSRLTFLAVAAAVSISLALGAGPALADGTSFTTVPTGFISTPVVTQTATANAPGWDPVPDSLTYQWYYDGTALDGETSDSYTVPDAEEGGSLYATITAHKAGLDDTTITTPAQTVLGMLSSTPAQLTGSAVVGQTISVTGDEWTPSDTTVEYRWGNELGGEDYAADGQSSFTLRPQDTSGVWVEILAYRDGYESQHFYLSTPVLPDHFIVTQDPTISGIARTGDLLTANDGYWSPTPTSFSYQWTRDGVAISGQTSQTYIPQAQDVGHDITVDITAHRDGWPDVTADPSVDTIAAGYFATSTPTISGTPKIGSALTAQFARWRPSADYVNSYNWFQNGVLDTTQVGAKFYPTVAGARVTVSVTAGDSAHGLATSPLSVATKSVAAGTFAPFASQFNAFPIKPEVGSSMGGTFADGSILWPTTNTWYLDGHQVSTAATFTPTAAEWHHKLSLRVTVHPPGLAPVVGTTVSAEIENGWFSGQSIITPAPTVGHRVSIDLSNISPRPSHVTVVWYTGTGGPSTRHIVARGGSFVIPASLGGKVIYAKVTLYGSHINTQPMNTRDRAVAKGSFSLSPVPVVHGNAVVGSTLSFSRGTWAPSKGVHYAYQWMTQTSAGAAPVAISKATGSTFRITSAQRGKVISVRVTASLTGYNSAARLSEPTAIVAEP